MTTALTPNEIEYGRLAIERRLATRDQVRECAEMRSGGNPDHLAKLLVSRGYLTEPAARGLYDELARGGRAAGAPGGSAFGTHPGGLADVVCPACGARSQVAAGAVSRCASCGAGISTSGFGGGQDPGSATFAAPGLAGGSGHFPAGSGYGQARGPGGTHPQGSHPASRGPNGSHGPGGSHGPAGSGMGSHRFGPAGSAGIASGPTGPTGSSYGPGGSHGVGAIVEKPDGELPPNIAPDDPIAHAMSVRRNADGTVETVFGPYDILGEIARGGMGIVYRARQRSLKRIVALKVMKEGENASEKQIRRFKRETEAAAKLQHPNIVAVHEVGCHEGFHYFTMDLIEGDPLDAIVKRSEKLPVERVLQVVMEVAQAIHYAHGKGIIHRDLKPANVLLDTDGHPKVTDFGLAKNIDHKSMLTKTGAVVGTPFYMPPEQARGDVDIDQRADVYALGVILYELLTLKLPFHGETTMEVYHKILEEDPLPPRKHDSRIDRDVDTIVLKAMEKDLTRRYQTAQELAEDVQRYLNGDPIKARPLGLVGRQLKRARKNMAVVGVTGVVVASVLGSAGLFWWRHVQIKQQELEGNRSTEWETFLKDVENQCINARSQITTGVNRARERDAQGAVQEIQRSLRYLDDLPLLAKEYVRYNTPERTAEHLAQQQKAVDAIYHDAWLELGRAYVLKADQASYEEALKCFQSGLERDPGSAALRLEVGKVKALQGQHKEALAVFAEILQRDAGHVDARLEMGRVHDLSGQPLEALACFSQVIDRRDAPVEKAYVVKAHLLRGQTAFRLGRLEEARKDLDRVLTTQDDSFEGYVTRGRIHQALGHHGEASEDLNEAIDLNPSLPDGYYHRGELYFAQRKYAEAIKDYEVAISRSPQFYAAYVGYGRALEWVLDYDRARQQYEEVLKASEPEAKKLHADALAALADLDQLQAEPLECLLETEERLRTQKSGEDGALGPAPPLAALKEARDKRRLERLSSARQRYEQALALNAEHAGALLGRARLQLTEGRTKEAAQDLERCKAALQNRLEVRFASQQAAADSSTVVEDDDDWDSWSDGQPAAGKGEDKVRRVDEQLAECRVLLGQVALQEQDLERAKAAFNAALEVDPDSSAAHGGLGHVLRTRDDPAKARQRFEKARQLSVEGQDESALCFQEGDRQTQQASRSKKPENFRKARQSYARALVKNPTHARAALEWARLCAEWSYFDAAVPLAQRAVEADPFLREGYELLGFLLTQQLPLERNKETGRPEQVRDYALGRAQFDKAIEVSGGGKPAADAYYGRALARLSLGEDLEAARKDLEAAIEAIPAEFREAEPRLINQSIAYLERLAEVREKLGDKEGGAAARARVEEVRRAAKEAAEAELNEGRVLRDRLNYSEAIKHFDRAIELNPGYDEAFYDRGTCYLKIGNFVPGILDFSRALELNPRIADQVYNKVYQISYVVDLTRVITELNKIVSDHPSVSYVIFLRGFFYVAKTEFKRFDQSDLDQGIADFNKCLELNPTHVTAMLYRGFLYYKMAGMQPAGPERQKLFDRAMEDYFAALKDDPESGISHYLQALCWAQRSADETLGAEKQAECKRTSIAELKTAFDNNFKGYERIKNEHGFDPVRQEKEFVDLMRGK